MFNFTTGNETRNKFKSRTSFIYLNSASITQLLNEAQEVGLTVWGGMGERENVRSVALAAMLCKPDGMYTKA